MSKRFGRNQRRALRQQLEQEQQRAQQLAGNLEYISRSSSGERAELLRVLRNVADTLGEHFAALPAQVRKSTGLPDVIFERGRSISRSMSPHGMISAVSEMIEIIELHRIDASSNIDMLRGAICVHLKTPAGRSACYISRETFRALPRHVLVDQVSRQLVDQIAQELRRYD